MNAFSQVRISHVLRFISVCDLFTDDSSSYVDCLKFDKDVFF
jgi:hypothetical protein